MMFTCKWQDLEVGKWFFHLDDQGYLCHLGIKIAKNRYLNTRETPYQVSGFCDNKEPVDMMCFVMDNPDKVISPLKRQIHYLYHNAPNYLKDSFDKDFPNNREINGICCDHYYRDPNSNS